MAIKPEKDDGTGKPEFESSYGWSLDGLSKFDNADGNFTITIDVDGTVIEEWEFRRDADAGAPVLDGDIGDAYYAVFEYLKHIGKIE